MTGCHSGRVDVWKPIYAFFLNLIYKQDVPVNFVQYMELEYKES